MKNLSYSKVLELKDKLKNKEDFKVTYDGEDFGIYKYNKDTNRYEGDIGYLSIQSIIDIIKGLNDFIEIE